MKDHLTYFTCDEKTYPALMSFNVMEWVQETYGSIDNWQKAVIPEPGQEKKTDDFVMTMAMLINEGIDYQNDTKSESEKFLTKKQVGWLITFMGISNARDVMTEALLKFSGRKPTEDGKEKN